jgi:hypothetical protein
VSDKPEGPGWWIASDGNWYPPELHPSVREGSRMRSPVDTPVQPAAQTGQHSGGGTPGTPGPVAAATHVGPQFPDLFQKAMEGSHLADNIIVKNGMDDERSGSFTSSRSGGTPVGAGSGGAGKRKWRKGH